MINNMETNNENIVPRAVGRSAETNDHAGMAIASLVLGIVSGVFFLIGCNVAVFIEAVGGFLAIVGSIVGIVALIFGLISVRSRKKAFAITGITIGGAVIFIMVVVMAYALSI